MLAAAVLAAVYLIWSPPSADLAAQTFRADLFADHGFLVFNNLWYAGHYLPGYSLVYPPLGALLGPRLLGALASVAAAALFASVARRAYGDRARLAIWWFGAGTVTNLLTGRITFALGLAVGLGGVWALQRGRPALAGLLGALTALTSPVAALFVALAAAVGATGSRRTTALALGASALGVSVALALAFPTSGWFPFVPTAFLPVPLLALAVLVLVPREDAWLRRGIVLYLLLAIAFACFHTPVGANVARLGALLGGPLVALALAERRPMALALLAVPLLYWQWVAPVRDLSDSLGDDSVHASYFEPLVAELDREARGPVRIEVPPTRDRWEGVYVAPHYPLARGWLRQLESDDFHLFSHGRLTASSYRAWLGERAVSFVAVPDASFDYLAEDEAALIENGLPYLQRTWADEHWTLYRVRDPQPLVAPGGATLTSVGPADFSLAVDRPGDYVVRIHDTPYWAVSRGRGCVAADGEWTRVTADAPGDITVSARFSVDGLLRHESSCSG